MIDILKNFGKPDTSEFYFNNESKVLRITIVDFLFRIKDTLPFSDPVERRCIDGLNIIMEFMFEYSFKPSAALFEEYSKSEFTKKLNTLPTREYINNKIKERWQMSEERYERLRKRFESRPPFVFYINPNIEFQEKVYGYELMIGSFAEGTEVSVNK